MEKLLTPAEFGSLFGWKTSTVYQKVYRRELEIVRVGRNVRFTPEYARRLVEEGTVPAIAS